MTQHAADRLKSFIAEVDTDHMNAVADIEGSMLYGRPQVEELHRTLGRTFGNVAELLEHLQHHHFEDPDIGSREHKAALLALTALTTCMVHDVLDEPEEESVVAGPSVSDFLRNVTHAELNATLTRIVTQLDAQQAKAKKPVEALMEDIQEAYPGVHEYLLDLVQSSDEEEAPSEYRIGVMAGGLMMFAALRALAEIEDLKRSVQ